MNYSDELVRRSARVFTPALHLYYPIAVSKGQGTSVYDDDGKKYLDFSSGLAVLNIGHNHPRVVAAARRQMENLIHTGGIYYNETTVAAAEKLVSITPEGLDMLFFSNSGAEAVEGAIKLARYVTERQGIISFTRAFHGRTLGALSVTTSSAAYRRRYHPLLPSVYQVPYPYCFRCPYRQTSNHCDMCCIHELEETLKYRIPGEETAAVLIEPFLGEGGYFPAPRAFLKAVRKLCDRHGILLIFDEVQSGMGRTGCWFAADHAGVAPDIMTVAKGIASGFPLSAVVARRALMEKWPSGAHGTTFGGNPVSCAASIATIDAITEEKLLGTALERGASLMERLGSTIGDHPLVGQIRGFGYMVGIEFVTCDGLPNGSACEKVLEQCLKRGLILIGCGPERHVIRFIPPLNVSEEELETGLTALEEGVSKLS
ncbi:MAG: aspartate aminotransferase family protein [Geobacteraceae bacterium]|nr:aspartate aminotransferase family protein [Geobacteraceae bacterium]